MADVGLHSLFLRTCEAAPNSFALAIEGQRFTYSELQNRVTPVRDLLSRIGGTQNRNVALIPDGTLSTYVGLLAILQAGHAYVPLAPSDPVARLVDAIDNVSIGILVVGPGMHAVASAIRQMRPRLHVIIVDRSSVNHIHEAQNPDCGDVPATGFRGKDAPNLAYIMHTSGSTGRPKGVPVSHSQAIACVDKLTKRFALSPLDRVSNMFDLTFDPSVMDLFGCWKVGACLFVPNRADKILPAEFIVSNRLSIWGSAPSVGLNLIALGALQDDRFESLRVSWFIGEALPKQVAQEWMRAAPQSSVFNVYGPTEVTIAATIHEVAKSTFELDQIPIGEVLPNVASAIIAANGQSAADEEQGELWLGGEQVVEGYWNDSMATDASFKTCDIGSGNVERWYRTGDIVSRSRFGLMFHGRSDRQVKIAGKRTELQDVEIRLRVALDVALVAVVPIVDQSGICKSVAAFLGEVPAERKPLATLCAAHMPSHMVPSEFHILEELPLNRSGKINYRELDRIREARTSALEKKMGQS